MNTLQGARFERDVEPVELELGGAHEPGAARREKTKEYGHITATGAGAATPTLSSYTNSAGTAGRTAALVDTYVASSAIGAFYRFGLQDIDKVIAAEWTKQQQRQLNPLFMRFPFNRRAAQDVDLAALDALRLPDGAFWQRFQRIFAPVCAERPGGFTERRGALQQVTLPKDLLPLTNQLLRLSRTLWDKDGKRKALVYQINPKILPSPAPAEAKLASATLSFLNHGSSFVYGVNTRTANRALSVAWWSSDSASVGIEVSLPDSGRKQTLSVDVSGAPFSFHHLVAQARLTTDGLATWTVPGERPGWSRDIRFHLGEDPFAAFQIKVP